MAYSTLNKGLLFFICLFWSCTGTIQIAPIVQPTLPDFNFQVRSISGIETIRQSEFQRFEVYLKPYSELPISQPYTFSFSVSDFDGNMMYRNTVFRPNDPLVVPYEELKRNNHLLSFHYYPVKPAIGTHQINFIATDPNGNQKTVKKRVTVIN